MALPITIGSGTRFASASVPPPFFVGGAVYVIVSDSSSLQQCRMYRSTDPESGFTEQDSANRPTQTFGISTMQAVLVGTTIHVLLCGRSGTTSLEIRYCTFNTSTNQWAINEVAKSGTSIAGGPSQGCGIGVRSDGDVLILYEGEPEAVMGTDRQRAYIGRREGGSWTVDIRPDTQGKFDGNIFPGVAIMADQTNDRFQCLFTFSSQARLSTYLNGNTFGANDVQLFSGAAATVTPSVGSMVSFTDGANRKVRFSYTDGSSNLKTGQFNDADSPSVSALSGNVNDSSTVAFASLTFEGTTQHMIYRRQSNLQEVFVDKTGAGDDTWGTDVSDVNDGTTITLRSAGVYDRSGLKLGYCFEQTSGFVPRFNERSLSAPVNLDSWYVPFSQPVPPPRRGIPPVWAITPEPVAQAIVFPAEVGTFTLSGQNANLLRGRKILAESGAYTLTGQAVTLTRGKQINAESASFALTGQNANLLNAQKILAEVASYTLTGQNVTTVRGHSPRLNAYRFYNDDGGEATSTPKAAQDTTISIANEDVFHLRLRVDEAGADTSGLTTDDWQLQYRKNAGAWANVSDVSSNVQAATGTGSPPVLEGFTEQVNTAVGNPLTLTKPSGVQAGDLLMLFAMESSTGNSGFSDNVTGWNFGGTIGNSTQDAPTAWWWRIATGSEGATQDVTSSSAGNNVLMGWYLRISGVDQTTPINVSQSSTTDSNSTTHTISGVTTSVNNCRIFYLLCNDDRKGAGAPFTVDSPFVETDELICTVSTEERSACFGSRTLTTAGSSGNATVTATGAATSTQWQIAVAPASGSGSQLTDGGATTNRATNGISDPGSGSFVAGEQESANGLVEDNQLTAGNFTEHVWALHAVDADLASSDVIDFRLLRNGSPIPSGVTPSFTYSVAVVMPAQAANFSLAGEDVNLSHGFPLQAESASFSLTGQDVTLSRGKQISAESASFSLTGQNANLLQGYQVDAEFASFTLSGQVANLLQGYQVDAESGAFTLTGQDVTLSFTVMIEAESAAFTLTGQDANLLHGQLISAEVGAFALSGQTVNLLQGYEIDAEFASFTLSGQEVNLSRNVPLLAESASFILAGQDVDLLKGSLISAESGTFTLTGQNVDLSAGIIIQAESAAFALSGQAVNLLQGYQIDSESGAFTLTGQDVNLSRNVPLLAESGAFTLTGQNANLLQGYAVDAEVGAFSLTGQDVDLLQTYILNAEVGAFTLTGQVANLLQGYKIEAEFAAYALSGQDVDLLQGYAVFAESGAFTLNGQLANLLKGYRVFAESGPFIFVGQDVTLSEGANPVIAAESGTFTLSGQTVDLLHDWLIQAESSAFIFVGQTVNLFHDYHLTAEVGTFTFSGQNANLFHNSVVSAEAGSFLLSGQDVDLSRDVPILAEVGTFTFTGQDVTLTESGGNIVISAEVGAFTFSGQDVDLLQTKLVTAEAGVYTFNGQVVNLNQGYKVSAEVGTFDLNGQDVQFVYDRLAQAQVGAFTFSGQTASLLKTYHVTGESASYLLSGQDVDLSREVPILAETGIFVFTGQNVGLTSTIQILVEVATFTLTGQDANLDIGVEAEADYIRGYIWDYPAFGYVWDVTQRSGEF